MELHFQPVQKRKVKRLKILVLGAAMTAMPIYSAAEAPSLGQLGFEALLGDPVNSEELGYQRGQADTFQLQGSAISEQGAVLGNQIEYSPSGSNIINSGALHDNHGLTTVIQNSGHHVIIQEATNINVSVRP
ncbi:hypothetical protein LRD18_08335 [Halorhodospira halochloris]|uniref:Glutamate synthase [NADPH n=1 Tax=Halorhodospira halochloris TaxID=1052 RepID=A0A0X8X845_HALHR|nr:hypothetical protein [Halorhodospira halochloris]MBK1650786.1 hypothetical protein [Halorhodospira halochloris]MCG5530878.1 hypothetical protein [Halorhodospira halochloris]MCG5548847.1 hypothetical protein [Halorhodospira halochloris]BAU56718.1 glutamate synthase [NADPH [Halorhodospira halochloris]